MCPASMRSVKFHYFSLLSHQTSWIGTSSGRPTATTGTSPSTNVSKDLSFESPSLHRMNDALYCTKVVEYYNSTLVARKNRMFSYKLATSATAPTAVSHARSWLSLGGQTNKLQFPCLYSHVVSETFAAVPARPSTFTSLYSQGDIRVLLRAAKRTADPYRWLRTLDHRVRYACYGLPVHHRYRYFCDGHCTHAGGEPGQGGT